MKTSIAYHCFAYFLAALVFAPAAHAYSTTTHLSTHAIVKDVNGTIASKFSGRLCIVARFESFSDEQGLCVKTTTGDDGEITFTFDFASKMGDDNSITELEVTFTSDRLENTADGFYRLGKPELSKEMSLEGNIYAQHAEIVFNLKQPLKERLSSLQGFDFNRALLTFGQAQLTDGMAESHDDEGVKSVETTPRAVPLPERASQMQRRAG